MSRNEQRMQATIAGHNRRLIAHERQARIEHMTEHDPMSLPQLTVPEAALLEALAAEEVSKHRHPPHALVSALDKLRVLSDERASDEVGARCEPDAQGQEPTTQRTADPRLAFDEEKP